MVLAVQHYHLLIGTAMSLDPDVVRLQEKVQEAEKDISNLFKRLFGNGDPGLLARVQAAEGKISNLIRLAWVLSTVILGLIVELVKELLP